MSDDRRPDLSIVVGSAGRAGPPPGRGEVLKADDSPTFYWELVGDEFAVAHEAALEDEGYLANDLITGASILAVTERYEACPAEVRLPSPEVESTLYTDAIAAILQVAAWNGHDVGVIADVAIARQQQTYGWSAAAVRDRPQHAPTRRI